MSSTIGFSEFQVVAGDFISGRSFRRSRLFKLTLNPSQIHCRVIPSKTPFAALFWGINSLEFRVFVPQNGTVVLEKKKKKNVRTAVPFWGEIHSYSKCNKPLL